MYELVRTDTFDAQLREIIFRISDNSGSEKALEVLSNIENSLLQLSDFPLIGTKPRYTVLSRQEFRVLVPNKNLIFYKVNEKDKTVRIEAIADTRKDYVRAVLGVSDINSFRKNKK